jgi:peroxiredoxin
VEKDIWKSITNENFAMLVIGREHTKEELVKFRTEKAYTFPIAADTKRAVYSLFATQTIPRNLVVDKKGNIVYFAQGFSEEEFNKMVALIKESL